MFDFLSVKTEISKAIAGLNEIKDEIAAKKQECQELEKAPLSKACTIAVFSAAIDRDAAQAKIGLARQAMLLASSPLDDHVKPGNWVSYLTATESGGGSNVPTGAIQQNLALLLGDSLKKAVADAINEMPG